MVPRMTPDDVLESIRRFVATHGYVPTRRDFDAKGNGLASRGVVERYFRQWQCAVIAAGFTPTIPLT